MKNKFLPTILFSILLSTILVATGIGPSVHGQTAQQDWSPPVNLSHTGNAKNPGFAVDSSGRLHVIWLNAIGDTYYTYQDGQNWAPPKKIYNPMEGQTPRLLADSKGNIHAFWINRQSGNVLMYSLVKLAAEVGPKGWIYLQPLAISTANYDVTSDKSGRLSLAYISQGNNSSPAGVYSQSSNDSGKTWSYPVLIYQSEYLQRLSAEQANIHITSSKTGDTNSLFAVWDNPLRKRIYFSKSVDAGITWDEPLEIDKPQINSGSAGPFNLSIGAKNDQLALIWEWGQPGSQCSRFFQVSQDGGKNWGKRQKMPDDLNGCLLGNQFVLTSFGLLLIQTTVQNQVYFRTWDGTLWTTPQSQPLLSGFTDPETFDSVNFRSLKYGLADNNRLLVVGYDTGSGGDVWETWRTLAPESTTISNNSAWTTPVAIAKKTTNFFSFATAADTSGRMHVFWGQRDENNLGQLITSIYYTNKSGDIWSKPAIIQKLEDGGDVKLAVNLDTKGRLFLIWEEELTKSIFFSWANANQAINSGQWSSPQAIPAYESFIDSRQIVVVGDQVNFFYTVNVNENRGVYLTYSTDLGNTWSDSKKILDGAAENWEIVAGQDTVAAGNGVFHMLISRRTVLGSAEVSALYYSRSEDNAQSWSKPEVFVEKPITWSLLVQTNDRILHRIWVEWENNNSIIRHQYSRDQGNSWSNQVRVINNSQNGNAALAADAGSQLHLLRLLKGATLPPAFQYLEWNGTSWSVKDAPILDTDQLNDIELVDTAISNTNQLIGIYVTLESTSKGGAAQYTIQSISLLLEITEITPVALPALIPTSAKTLKPTGTATVTLPPTPTLMISSNNPEINSSQNPQWLYYILGAVVVLAGIGGIFLYAIVSKRKKY